MLISLGIASLILMAMLKNLEVLKVWFRLSEIQELFFPGLAPAKITHLQHQTLKPKIICFPPATPHHLQSQGWLPGGIKWADRIWKGVYS